MDTPPDPRPDLVPTAGALVPLPEQRARRWRLLRDLVLFQGKLLLDGIKDLVLGPIALIAAVTGLALDREDPGRSFRQVMRLGEGFDRWVDLFGEHQRARAAALPSATDESAEAGQASTPSPAANHTGLDAYVARVEQALADQVRRGGLTAKAKDAIDQTLDSLQTGGRDSDPKL